MAEVLLRARALEVRRSGRLVLGGVDVDVRRGELLAEHGPQPSLELLVGLAVLRTELPLVAEQGGLVDVGGDVVEREALHDA